MYRIFLFALLLAGNAAFSQTLTLQQCIDSAVANNVRVRQAGLQTQSAEVAWRQSRSNILPLVSADINHGIYQGRSIDPSSNSYVNQSLTSANYGVNAGIVVFNGGAVQQTIRQNAAAYEASKMEWQGAKDLLVLNVILAYISVLNSEDFVTAETRRAEVSAKQLERLEVLNSKGAIRPSELSDMKGQLMNDQFAVTLAKNGLEGARLTLAQLMNRPYSPSMKVERIDINSLLEDFPLSGDQVYETALQQFPAVRAMGLRKRSAEYAARAARGNLFPVVSVGGGLNTNYSSIAQNASGKVPYNSQLQNNVSTSIGVGISIPIFGRFAARNRIKLAEIAVQNSALEEENAKMQLRQMIDAAFVNMTNARERYLILEKSVAAYTESFKAAEVRYNAGVGTSIDYLTAKDRLDRANITLISARYDFVLRKKILDYYQNAR